MASMDQILAASKAAWPMLWEDAGPDASAEERAAQMNARQASLDMMGKALDAAAEVPVEAEDVEGFPPTDGTLLGDWTLNLPEDTAMVQQILTMVCFINNEGRTAYAVRFMGEGLKTSWLGMATLAQDYILRMPGGWDGVFSGE
jgi:hypothetical protein